MVTPEQRSRELAEKALVCATDHSSRDGLCYSDGPCQWEKFNRFHDDPSYIKAMADVVEAFRAEARAIEQNETPHVAANTPLVAALRALDSLVKERG